VLLSENCRIFKPGRMLEVPAEKHERSRKNGRKRKRKRAPAHGGICRKEIKKKDRFRPEKGRTGRGTFFLDASEVTEKKGEPVGKKEGEPVRRWEKYQLLYDEGTQKGENGERTLCGSAPGERITPPQGGTHCRGRRSGGRKKVAAILTGKSMFTHQ